MIADFEHRRANPSSLRLKVAFGLFLFVGVVGMFATVPTG